MITVEEELPSTSKMCQIHYIKCCGITLFYIFMYRELNSGRVVIRFYHYQAFLSSSPSFPYIYDMAAPTNSDPETAFPIVTGIKLWNNAVSMVTSLVLMRPAGSKNMLATECSKPILTKVDTGSQIDRYFPVMSFACILKNTARHTNQLQNMALTKSGPSS
mmetsp:Transcript_33142/g.55527  ORF Transcript_33142/g.55527 Transcript_33142/m.55527 type:complete len:161 (+) Transcript_33142:35-517(+)